MDGISSITTIDQKMAEMRIKNLELLKRHQEIEEDRQLAEQSGATTSTVEYTKDTMRGTTKTRGRHNTTQQHSQENQQEQIHRPPVRRKYDNDRTENSTPRVQKVDYNRLKHERAQETTNHQRNNSFISAELREYAYPCYYQSENNHVTRIGSGRFIQQQQQQRSQEQGQRRREERMRRTGAHNNGHPGGPSEFHLDISQIPMWQNNPMPPPPPPPIHLQLLPTNINGHPTDLNHLMNNGGDQLDQSAYMHNFMYTSSAQSTPFNGNGTVYFAHPATPMAAAPPPSAQSSQTHFHQFHPTRTFENSNRHQFHHSSHFQSSPVFQPTPPVPPAQILTPSSSSSHIHQQQDNTSMEVPPRFRRLKRSDQDNKYSQSRPMSGDFDQIRNSSSRFTNENRYQSRPQSFYDFSSQQQQQPSNNFFRSSSNNNNNLSNRHQRNNNNTNSLPLSAYMNTDENSYSNENSYWGTSTYQRRRSNQHQRNYHQDKHQFPLSLYDPRQYGFNNNYSRRNDFNNRSNSNRRLNNNNNNNNANSNRIDDSNDIDLIEEWWEDDNPELIGTNQTQTNLDSQTTTTVDDSGNSSLSTSMHLKESTLDDDENNRSINDSVNQPSDASITDNNIIESLDKLQQQLKFEEAVDNQLTSEFLASNNETTAYDTAHFLQWAKEKFREELAGRLTAKEIEQHDAVTSDDNDDEDIVVTAGIKLDQYQLDQVTDDDIDNHMDELEDDLNEKLIIEEKLSKTIVVE